MFPGGATAAALSPDGRYLAASSAANVEDPIKVWDVEQNKLLAPPFLPRQAVWNMAFHPDGRRLLTAGDYPPEARVWDVVTGKMTGVTFPDKINCQAIWSRDGSKVVTGGETVQVWDANTGARLQTLEQGLKGRIVAMSPDQKLVATGYNGPVNVWDLATGALRFPPPRDAGSVHKLAFSPSGGILAAGGQDGFVRLYDTGRLIEPPLQHTAAVRVLGFSSDGSMLVTGTFRGSVQLWDVASGRRFGHTWNLGHMARDVSFSADDRWIVTADYNQRACLVAAPQAVAGDRRNITEMLQILTGVELSATGDLRPLPADEWLARKREFESSSTRVRYP